MSSIWKWKKRAWNAHKYVLEDRTNRSFEANPLRHSLREIREGRLLRLSARHRLRYRKYILYSGVYMHAHTRRYNVQAYSTGDIERRKRKGGWKDRREDSEGGQRGQTSQKASPISQTCPIRVVCKINHAAGEDPTIFKSNEATPVIQLLGRNFSPIRDTLATEASSFHLFLFPTSPFLYSAILHAVTCSFDALSKLNSRPSQLSIESNLSASTECRLSISIVFD